MQHPDMQKREWQARFRKCRESYWYRWMGLYTLALFAILLLVLASRASSWAPLLVLSAGYFTVGIFITDWFARRRAQNEVGGPPGDGMSQKKPDA